MKSVSTGFGLCVAAAAALAYPFVSSLAPNANASTVTAAAAVTTAATGQTGPTIVWYGVTIGQDASSCVFRAWSDGRVEGKRGFISCNSSLSGQRWFGVGIAEQCGSDWVVVSDPAQGLTYRSDINFDEKVDGADLGQLLADWGNAPRQDIPPSDCPLALINP
jgi:hypothetical protein